MADHVTAINDPDGLVVRADVLEAAARIRGLVRRTPIIDLEAAALNPRHPALKVKLESLQVTGAFKARGALNSVLALQSAPAGVCAASGGNHGQAVAWAAGLRGLQATVFVPTTCPAVKLARLRDYGATVHVVGDVYDDSLIAAVEHAKQSGAHLIHPFDQPTTVAGAGTVTLELLDQSPDLDTVLVPVGGGGLLAGAVAVLQGTGRRIVAVEPTSARCLGAALDAGHPVDVTVAGPAVDSLGPKRVGQLGLNAAHAYGIEHVEVSDQAIVQTRRDAWAALRIGLEGGGATALAALLSGAYRSAPGEDVAVLCCGGNVEPCLLA